MWGNLVFPDLSEGFYKSILRDKIPVTVGDAIFRKESNFVPANLKRHSSFWEQEILRDHPHKKTLLKWIKGIHIEEFLNSFTTGEYQGIKLNSFYPERQEFQNYVPSEFEQFMDDTVVEWLRLGALQKWEDVRQPNDPEVPVVVSPLGIEPKKPRSLWDGRYVNEFCKDIPFSMDSAAKVAEVSWLNAYLFKLDHKNGYLHVPIHKKSRKYFGVFWKGVYYVLAVLPFGWKSSPVIYHTLTEAVAMYLRSLGIPMLDWIDDMLGSTEQSCRELDDEEQFQSAVRSMVVVTHVLFKAGYFMGISKCCIIPEKVMTYLGIECNTISGRFFVPQEQVDKYIPLLSSCLAKQWVSYADIEKLVGKLVSLECAVPAGMWYTREQYSALRLSGLSPSSSKTRKQNKYIKVTAEIAEEWNMWVYFLTVNKGSPWKKFNNVFVAADIHSDASGRSFAGVVDFPNGVSEVTAGEFDNEMLLQDIQVKEGEALRATLNMMVVRMPQLIKGKTLVCKVDNQVLKAVLERKGTSQNLALNTIGKQIYWLQDLGEFFISVQYVQSEINVADKYTRESPGLEASLSQHHFKQVWDKWGPFDWDLMATSANVKKDPNGKKLFFFSRYYDPGAKGTNIFNQELNFLERVYCFPPFPIIGMLLKHLEQQKINCVLVLPAINAPWVNLVSSYIEDLLVLAGPYDSKVATVLSNSGKRIPKIYPHAIIAVKIDFYAPNSNLSFLHC